MRKIVSMYFTYETLFSLLNPSKFILVEIYILSFVNKIIGAPLVYQCPLRPLQGPIKLARFTFKSFHNEYVKRGNFFALDTRARRRAALLRV